MGIAKTEWIESEERGWSAPDKYVCAECVEDGYLKSNIVDSAIETHCDYCDRKSEEVIAAPVAAILEPIAFALFEHFCDPTSAGLPRDSGEWVDEDSITYTQDALMTVGLLCNDDLFEDIAGSFVDDAWYPCANGHWVGLHEHEELGYAWAHFIREIKHHTRYFFIRNSSDEESITRESYPALALLQKIGEIVESLELVKSIPEKTTLYRARCINQDVTLSAFEEIGPPSPKQANGGRMNPSGISYFYLALDKATAVAEILNSPPCRIAVGQFETIEDVLLLDLSELPELPSIFDSSRQEERQGLIFLEEFIDTIAKPVTRDGGEHVDYIPSQVISEFFAKVYRTSDDASLRGIIYRSAIHNVGKNVVIFPSDESDGTWERVLELKGITHISFDDWEDIKNSI